MEYAIFISRSHEIGPTDKDFSRLYFGNEFCQELIPSLNDLERVLKGTTHFGFTLVTPYVTDEGLGRLTTLFDRLSKEKGNVEVVFNDWGVFRILHSGYPSLQPVMGRLLNKMKRGPRILNFMEAMPSEDLRYFRASSLTLKIFRDFLISNEIRRVEFDNTIQGFDLNFAGIDISLYLPFVYATTTRYCLVNGCDNPAKKGVVGIFPCKRECQRYTFFLEHEVMPVPLIRKGNTVFYKNETVPADIGNFSRIVIEPEIPM